MQNVAFTFLVCDMQSYQWLSRCNVNVGRCHCISMLLLAYPVEPTGYIVHLKHWGKREHQCGDDVVYVKTGTKPFTQNSYFVFSIYHRCSHISHLAIESRIFRKSFKMIISSTLKKHVSTLWRYGVSPHSTASHVFKSFLNITLCDCFFVLCTKLCIHDTVLFLIV